MPFVHRNERLTYADYLTWPEGERWELVDGEAFAMTPAPSFGHQRVTGRIYYLLEAALHRGPCVPCVSPVDVVLAEDTVVQPDVVVVCDPSKIEPAGIRGAPDLVVEVLSLSTALRDRGTKRDLYERHGLREYLTVDAPARCAERYLLREDGTYGKPDLFGPDDSLRLASLGGLEISLAEVFEAIPVSEVEASS